MSKDQRVDDYIAKSADFAKPILTHLRELIHSAFPEIEETWKWSFPHFDYKGTVCGMAGFKEHCAFGFWKASLMSDPHKILTAPREAMGQMGQIKSLADLPADDILIAYIREAVDLNEKGIKVAKKPKPAAPKKELVVPEYLVSALEGNAAAAETFEKFSYTNKKDYIEWLTEAKTDETRNKRLATAMQQLTEGKARHWKYNVK